MLGRLVLTQRNVATRHYIDQEGPRVLESGVAPSLGWQAADSGHTGPFLPRPFMLSRPGMKQWRSDAHKHTKKSRSWVFVSIHTLAHPVSRPNK